ncbi:MAG: TldD/PmbA family protein, partial [SAR324 cluster bacterium]|nr:TldD/PmbA family protein [SAR324 cluster bacterium]
MLEAIANRFKETAPAVDYWTLRLVRDTTNVLSVRQNIVEPPTTSRDAGAMVTVLDGGGLGYGATSDLTPQGLAAAFDAAREWATATAGANLISPEDYPRLVRKGEYHYEGEIPWDAWSVGQKMELLQTASQSLKIHDDISDWYAFLIHTRTETLLVSSYGGWIEQSIARMQPVLGVVANRGAET